LFFGDEIRDPAPGASPTASRRSSPSCSATAETLELAERCRFIPAAGDEDHLDLLNRVCHIDAKALSPQSHPENPAGAAPGFR
jgi:hypothetical protein